MTGFRRGRPNVGDGGGGCQLPNLLTSTDFADSVNWVQQALGGAAAPTVTANAALAPNGTMTATRVDFPAVGSGQSSDIYQGIVTASHEVYTFSFYVRGVSGPGTLKGFFYDGTLPPAFSLAFTTSWQRVQFSQSLFNTGNTDFAIGFSDSFPSGQGGPASVYLWHPMVNEGPVACSYKEP